jgi:signal transduction histidine kinase
MRGRNMFGDWRMNESAYTSRGAAPETFDEDQILLATQPPSQGQRRLALAIVAGLLAAFAITVPFKDTPLPRVDVFLPVLAAALVINDLITSALLFAQFSIARQRTLLVLANGYLFTGLMVIPHALTFPGLFAPTGLLGAGLQTAVWLYMVWHVALPLSVIVYESFKGADSRTSVSRGSVRAEIGLGIVVVVAVAWSVTWFATTRQELLPALLDQARTTSLAPFVTGSVFLLGILALSVLWIRKSSVLDLWLMVMICAWLIEIMLSALLLTDRFSLGWYMGRIYSLIAGSVVLIVLLSETTTLYARLARAVMMQRREHAGRQFVMDAMAATIAHEVNQPLGAIALYGQASLRFLAETPPNIREVRAGLEHIVSDSVRGSEVIASLRAMFKKDSHERIGCSVNDIVREVLRMVEGDLSAQRASVLPELHEGLPQVIADRVQLQEVFLNLIMNAIEAMRSVTDRAKLLQIRSGISEDADGILVTIEDSGAGIDAGDRDRIFEPFFSTKSTGTGLGLSICRSIIEAHGGRLWASSAIPHGSIFHVVLPQADTVRGQ